MYADPELLWTQAKQHQAALVAEADRFRLLAAARRRWRREHTRSAAAPLADTGARGRPAGTLAPCEHSAAAPAR